MAEEDEDHRQRCETERDEAYEAIGKNQEECDKQLLTLSAGLIAVTISFVHNIVPLDQAICRWLLYTAICAFCVCIVGVLSSYQVSVHGQLKVAEYWAQKKKGADVEFPYHAAQVIRGFNIGNCLIFGVAISLLVIFAVLNLHAAAERKANMKIGWIQNGALLKSPSEPESSQSPKQNTPTASNPAPAPKPSAPDPKGK